MKTKLSIESKPSVSFTSISVFISGRKTKQPNKVTLPIMMQEIWNLACMMVGGKDGEHSGVSSVEISQIFTTQDLFIVGTISFERV